MAHVLPVAAVEIRDPVLLIVLMKTDDRAKGGCRMTVQSDLANPDTLQGPHRA